MCLIIASTKGKRIPDQILVDANRTNSNGAGVAWFDPARNAEKKIQFRKGLSLRELQTILEDDVRGAAHVVHFRIATIGGPLPELTHPFTVDEEASIALSGEAKAVLFHNGTYSQWKDSLLLAAASSGIPLPESPWSDTRAVAFMCNVYGKHMLSILDTSSRYLVFDGAEAEARRILLWGDWHDQDEFKFSNRGSCAFSSYQGGGRNFRGAAPGKSAANEENATVENETDKSSKPDGTENSPTGSRSLITRGLRARNSSKAPIRAKGNYDAWRVFSKTGDKQILGENETPTVVPSEDKQPSKVTM